MTDDAGARPATRVSANTAEEINRQIQERIEASVAYFAAHRDEIDQRLRELDREWDIERTLEANAAGVGFAGILLGAFVDRQWLVLPALVTAFLMQHAVQGWCPPLPVFRRCGVRTAAEIGIERYALKALRGDFDNIGKDDAGNDVRRVARGLLQAARR